MLSGYAKKEWATILGIGAMFTVTMVVIGMWPAALFCAVATFAVLTFFRDPDRQIPTKRSVMVSPADGKISSIHRVEAYEPFGNEPALCIRIFLSVLDVHVNRAPAHGVVHSITHKPGKYLNALNPDSAEVNASCTMVLVHPIRRDPVAAVRQVSGMLARTIVCAPAEGVVLQRGQRYGIIKLGSTTELYIPERFSPEVLVQLGQHVRGGTTILATISIGAANEATKFD